MPILHNQLVRLWGNPSYTKFKNSTFARKVFGKKDAPIFAKSGAYLTLQGFHSQSQVEPYSPERKYIIFLNPILGNALLGLGTEYFLKGIFLYKGYAINRPKRGFQLRNPYRKYANTKRLDSTETVQFQYLKRYLPNIMDLTSFDKSQEEKNKRKRDEIRREGRLRGMISIHYKSPDSRGILDYLHYRRNAASHTPTRYPEFTGIVKEIEEFLNFLSQKVFRLSLEELGDLEKNNI